MGRKDQGNKPRSRTENCKVCRNPELSQEGGERPSLTRPSKSRGDGVLLMDGGRCEIQKNVPIGEKDDITQEAKEGVIYHTPTERNIRVKWGGDWGPPTYLETASN